MSRHALKGYPDLLGAPVSPAGALCSSANCPLTGSGPLAEHNICHRVRRDNLLFAQGRIRSLCNDKRAWPGYTGGRKSKVSNESGSAKMVVRFVVKGCPAGELLAATLER